MSFISKLIGGFFAFLGGLFKGLLGLVGVGKKSEYFLEAKETEASKPAPTPAPESKPEPVAAPALASAEPANGKAPVTAPAAPAPVATAPAPAPQPVAASSNGSGPAKTFAPDFLITPSGSNGRRRPGPSLNRFIDMARKVNS